MSQTRRDRIRNGNNNNNIQYSFGATDYCHVCLLFAATRMYKTDNVNVGPFY